MKNVSLAKSFDFLKKLSKNNNRDWFIAHKDLYEEALRDTIAFVDALLIEMRKHDHIETASGKDSLFRIYRDVRFSKDKSPYKTYWAGSLKRATKKLRGGYYFELKPGGTFAAGGFFGPEPKDLFRIRKDIDNNYDEWKNMLSDRRLVKTFDNLKGEKLINPPKGFAKESEGIELIKQKQFIFERYFTDKKVLSPTFLKEMNQTFKNLRPYFDYMSEVLSTDANGNPVS